MKRREFIRQSIEATAASILIGGGALWLGSRQNETNAATTVFKPKNYRTAIDPARPVLATVRGKDYKRAVELAIDALGGIGAFIAAGDYVCIKPNIGWDRTAAQGANTHPDIVAELTNLCHQAGAAKIVVIDVPCSAPERSYARSGIKAAAAEQGAEVIIADDSYLREIDFGPDSLGKWQVLKPVLECNKLINVPVIKHHSLSGMTGAMKNWFGSLSGPRNRLHQQIDDNLVELCRLFQPTLTIADATRVMQRNGPTGGRPDDLIEYDCVAASIDQVAIESYSTRFLKKNPADFPFIGEAERQGLGVIHPPDSKIAEIEI